MKKYSILLVLFFTFCSQTSSNESVEEIIIELLESKNSEREGRAIDKDQIGSMEKKKQEGYF